ncbi:acyl-CoA thioesterase [Gordonia sp. NPDC003425]
MTTTDRVDELTDVIELRQTGDSVFVGHPRRFLLPRVFGGQVVGQAVRAAGATVTDGKRSHSVHAHFLRAGRADEPIEYRVESSRDGRAFSGRAVDAYQGDVRILSAQVSYHAHEVGFEHQHPATAYADPHDLHGVDTLARTTSDEWPMFYSEWPALDVRPVPRGLLADEKPSTTGVPARSQVWFRARNRIKSDDPEVHNALLACISDLTLLAVSVAPQGITAVHPGVQMASLDHAVWFHRDLRVDDWLLFDQESPIATNGRGLCRGNIYDADGRHVASVAQEGLIRPLPEHEA